MNATNDAIGRPPTLMRLYSAVMHRVPVSSGLTRLSFNRLTNRAFARCERPVVATMLNGVQIVVDPNDHDGRVLYLFGTNDPKVHTLTRALLAEGDRFLDVGANHATIGILAADRIGPTGQVHLFEPQPALCRRVGDAIREAGLGNVRLHQVGLMDRAGEMRLTQPERHTGRASFVKDDTGEGWNSTIVPVADIAEYVPPLIGSAPFGVKLDVEGAEPPLMRWLVRQPGLKFLIFEASSNRRELWDIVDAAGLRLYGLVRIPLGKRIRRIATPDEMGAFHDLVAVRVPPGLEPPRTMTPRRLGRLINAPRPGRTTPTDRKAP